MGALLLPMALLGCGAVAAAKLAYNQAPDLAYWWLDGYVDLTGAQSLRVKADLAQLQNWHRQTQLPQYAQTLQQLQSAVASELSAAQACRVVTDAQKTLAATLAQAEPAITSLAVTLQPVQLAAMARKFERGNTEWRSDYPAAAPQKVQQRRLRMARDRTELLYGSLNELQLQALTQGLARSVFDPATIYAERLRRQQDALQTLQRISSAPEPGAAGGQVQALLTRTLTSPDAAFRRHQAALLQEGCALLAEVHALATPEQRVAAARTLQRYEGLALSLASPPG